MPDGSETTEASASKSGPRRPARRSLLKLIGGTAVTSVAGIRTLSQSGAAAAHDVTVTIDNVGFNAWEVTNVAGEENVAETGVENPDLTLAEGTRYQFENNGWSTHPLAFRDSADDPLVSQDGTGRFEDDTDVEWSDTGETVSFTVTPELAAELDDYICTVHSTMNGGVTTTADAEATPAVSFITASHNTVGAGDAVLINAATLPDGGFIAVHDGRLQDGQPIASIIGVSEYLSAGEHTNTFVSLDTTPDAEETLTVRLYQDSNGNEIFDYSSTDGSEDTPYSDAGSPVSDTATAIPVTYADPSGTITVTTPDSADETPTEVTPPFDIAVTTSDFVVEAASNGVTDGHGHLHAVTDRSPLAAGEYFGFGTGEIVHYGTGTETLTLSADDIRPGTQTVHVQAGDANHVAYDLHTALTVAVAGTVEHYTNESAVVTTSNLLTAIEDWRAERIETALLLDVITAWRSGTPTA